MKKLIACALLASASPGFAATLFQADFGGAISGGSANVKAPFSGNGFSPSMPFSGTFVYDADLIPAAGTVNVNIPTVDGGDPIPSNLAFRLDFGPLVFTLADAVQVAPKVQYKNGQFNGFVYVSEFQFQTNWYQIRLEGNVLGVRLLTNVPSPGNPHGFVTGTSLINARLAIGDANLANVRPYVTPGPAVPEPATWAMMIGGFGMLGFAARRRTRVTYA